MDFQGQRLKIPADLQRLEEARAGLVAFLRKMGATVDDVARWELVLTEAVANAIVHGSGQDARRDIEVAWSAGGGQVRLEVTDSGCGPQENIPGAKLPADPLQTSGRGLFLIQQSCDRVEQWRGPEGFRLVMWRNLPGLVAADENSDQLLQSALAEISQCYESLAAFYRLGDALIAAERLADFFRQAMGDLAKVIPHDRMTLHLQPGLRAELREELGCLPFAACGEVAGPVVERVLCEGHELIWQDEREIAGDASWEGFACGVCEPLRAGGVTFGALAFARRRVPYLNAAELGTVRTYADLFGIALANANNAIGREREQQALREIEIAAAMQADLLPLPLTTSQSGWRAVVRRRCARTVAGDYVDVCPTPDGGLLLAMVDVMGKGMSAALLAGMVRTALRIHVDIGRPFERLIHDLNGVLCQQTGDLTLFATCALVRISPDRRRAFIVNAGHCPVLWLDGSVNGASREIAPSGPPLGLFLETEYIVEEQALASGDQLVLVTDGLYEWAGGADGAAGWTRLTELVQARRRAGGEAMWEAMQERIRAALPGETEARDDQTLLVWERIP